MISSRCSSGRRSGSRAAAPGLQEGNPTALVAVENLVDADYDLSNEGTRTLSPKEIRELRDIFAAMHQAYEAAPDKRRAKRPVLKETCWPS